MKDFFKKQWRWIIIALIFCFVFWAYYNKPFLYQKPPPISSIIEATSSISLGVDTSQTKIHPPLRLKIPVIAVDAEIEYVGLTPSGEMDVPQDPNNVAWFSLGSFPGAEGSAAIAGHLDDRNSQAAVFYNLKKLKPGDQLFIQDNQGGVTTFIVREIRVYDNEAFTPEVFTSSEGRHLNLITCAGHWSSSRGGYTQNLVVFTDISISNE